MLAFFKLSWNSQQFMIQKQIWNINECTPIDMTI